MDWINQIPLILLNDPIPASIPPPPGAPSALGRFFNDAQAPQGPFLMAKTEARTHTKTGTFQGRQGRMREWQMKTKGHKPKCKDKLSRSPSMVGRSD